MELIEKKTADERSYYIVKSNDFANQRFELTRARNNKALSVMEQKIFLYLVSKIKPEQEEFEYTEFDVISFCKVLGVKDHKFYYQNIKDAVEKLASKVMWLKDRETGKETLVRYLDRAVIYENSGKMKLKLDQELKPYLLNLKKNFMMYQLMDVIPFKSKYSFLLLDLMCAYGWKKKIIEFEIDDLKERLDVKSYNISNFRKLVIDKALGEINKYTIYNIQVEYIRKQRQVASIRFYVNEKQTLEEYYKPIVIDLGEVKA